ncbi:NUDIX hydrolase [Agromyces atrinae]|uniref:NUDIX hydrolase n=1 Tax=Agromyces atrinae TaxID=592376 RepID=UPI001F5772AA|nr:NUDIX hydrolase [Agromyces atrinae]MCI2957607.1 NUDIX hydrolase [Agromyces atrinae]
MTDDVPPPAGVPTGEAVPSGQAVPGPALAATVVLVRDSETGPEVLLLERPSDRGSFAGAWVFPGGAVEADDAGLGAAAVRETREETGLVLGESDLVELSHWTPPADTPRRFDTWFFVARAPRGSVALPADEIVASQWLRPADALALHATGALTLYPPTWVTLAGLTGDADVDALLTRISALEPPHFVGRFAPGRVLVWSDDVAFADDALLEAPGARHRLDLSALPWSYERS